MIVWLMEHWTWISGAGGLAALLRVLPKLVTILDAQWHLMQCQARMVTLDAEIDRLLALLAARLPGGNDSSPATGKRTTRTPTKP